jgi:hypothetical protein
MKEDRHCYKNFGLKWSFNYSQNTMVSSKLRYSKQNILHANLFIAMSDQAKCARSEAAFSASDNRCLADNDARRWITQNRQQREYGRDPVDLHNTIDDRRRDRARTSSPVVLAYVGSHSIREGRIPCSGAWAQADRLTQQVQA